MVREFALVDGSGEEYSLTTKEHFLYSPSGLGYEHENTYRQVGNRFILANSVPQQSVISGTVHFAEPNAYFDYQEFLGFCGRDGLKMEYRLKEMPSRRINRLTGTVDWTELYDDGNFVGTYDFISGNYTLTEAILKCDEDTVVTEEASFTDSAAKLYSIALSSLRDINELTYCNGIPASDINVSTMQLVIENANMTFIGGTANKIYFSLHDEALDGLTIQNWLLFNNAVFSYTLATPITGNNSAYKFNPKLMYNPEAQFNSINAVNLLVPSNGLITYVDSLGDTVTMEGHNLVLSNTEFEQELTSAVVSSSIINKNTNSRFERVRAELCDSAFKNALAQIDGAYYSDYPSSSPIFKYDKPIARLTATEYEIGSSTYHTLYHMSGTLSVDACVECSTEYTSATVPVTMTVRAHINDGNSNRVILHSESKTETLTVNSWSPSSMQFEFPIDYGVSFTGNPITGFIFPALTVEASLPPYMSIASIRKVGVQNFSIRDCSFKISGIDDGPELVSDLGVDAKKSVMQVYQADSQHYQRGVRLRKIEKTELTKFASLETKVEFECLEPWGDPFTTFVEHLADPSPVNVITHNSDCHSLSPCDLWISGPCDNPIWYHSVNGVEVTTGGYNGSIASGEKLLIRAKDGACGIYKVDLNDEITDVYQNSDFSKDRFCYIRYGENEIVVMDGVDATKQLDCYIEGELYYESV